MFVRNNNKLRYGFVLDGLNPLVVVVGIIVVHECACLYRVCVCVRERERERDTFKLTEPSTVFSLDKPELNTARWTVSVLCISLGNDQLVASQLDVVTGL